MKLISWPFILASAMTAKQEQNLALITFLGIGLLFIAISIPLIYEKIGPNPAHKMPISCRCSRHGVVPRGFNLECAAFWIRPRRTKPLRVLRLGMAASLVGSMGIQ